MRRRKKRAAPARRRRSSKMGALGSSFLMNAVGLIAGAGIARVLTSSGKILPMLDSKLKSAAVVVIGAYFPKLVKGPIGQSVGSGMVAAGGLGLLQSTGILGQIDSSLQIPVSVMAGDDLSVISGYGQDNLAVMAGNYQEEYNY